MKKLIVNGIIGSKNDPTISKDDIVFSYIDLENFLLSNKGEEFEVIIDSPGGSVEEGFKIYNKLKSLNIDTTAITANSIASIIFLSGVNRKVLSNTEMIIHNAWIDAEAFAGEKLNVHTLNALADIFAETDMRILDVYTSVAGKDKEQSLLAYMSQETNIGASKAKELGFATEIVENETKALSFKNRVITYSQNQINKIEMDQKDKMSTFEKMLNSLSNAFKMSVKNMLVQTSEGVELFIEGAGQEQFVGKTAFIAEEGIPTVVTAPVGNHVLSDGTEITVGEGGVIVTAVEAQNLEALKLEYEEKQKAMEDEKLAMEDEKKELQDVIVNLKKANEDNAKKVEEMHKAFIELKNQVAGDPDNVVTRKELSKDEFSKLTPAQKARELAVNKARNFKK